MTKHRLEAFSDGVLAIIITIMVLELRTRPAATSGRTSPGCGRRCWPTSLPTSLFMPVQFGNGENMDPESGGVDEQRSDLFCSHGCWSG
ncbi:TMEM175 family protein [Deinococcus sp.]|uniref:TMEM175 family protein n=1 Tax=Deinococcus sp. TaxID=47478 RepID=UPI00344BC3E4